MLKLGVVSDSHCRGMLLERFAELAVQARYDRVIHLGDVVQDARWLERNLPMPVQYVAGNCDLGANLPRELTLDLEQTRLLCVHGDMFGVKSDYARLSYYAETLRAKAALFGHTHIPFTGYVGSILMINPGALRYRYYLELEIDGEIMRPYAKKL